MIKAIKSSESVACQPKKNFSGSTKGSANTSSFSGNQLRAAEYKYGLACLWAATVQLENVKLKQELADATAHAQYCKACGK